MMHWGEPENELPQVASWEYVYDVDPNLVGTLLKLTVNAPTGIQSVSLTLNDANTRWASWAWNVGGVGPISPNLPYTIVLDPTLLANQAGSSIFAQSPGPIFFDPTQTISIQADELAVGFGQWNQFPTVPVVGGSQPWNYWSGLQVVPIPEPCTVVIWSLLGTLGVAFGWYRRRRAS